jgi:MFS family permease
MGTDKAGAVAAVIVLCSGAGMIVCGMISDRLCRHAPERKVALAIAYCLGSCLLLSAAFALPAGPAQLLLIGLGMLIATGTTGPAGAMVANLTHYSVHGTAFATLTLANNLLGLAPGPFITGKLSDLIGLHAAFQFVPLVSIAAAAVFFYARSHYLKDIARLAGERVSDPVNEVACEVKV